MCYAAAYVPVNYSLLHTRVLFCKVYYESITVKGNYLSYEVFFEVKCLGRSTYILPCINRGSLLSGHDDQTDAEVLLVGLLQMRDKEILSRGASLPAR